MVVVAAAGMTNVEFGAAEKKRGSREEALPQICGLPKQLKNQQLYKLQQEKPAKKRETKREREREGWERDSERDKS